MVNNLINTYSEIMENVNTVLRQNAAHLGIDLNCIFETGGDITGEDVPAPAICYYLEPAEVKSDIHSGLIKFYLNFDIICAADKSSEALRECYFIIEKLNKIIPEVFDYRPKTNPINHRATEANIALVTLSFTGEMRVIIL